MYTPAPDKVLHVVAGFLACSCGLAAGLLANRLGASVHPAWCGALACLLAAVAREAWNLRQGGPFSRADIAATLVGGGFGLLPYALGTLARP